MSLFNDLQDEQYTDWKLKGKCISKEHDPELWFDKYRADGEGEREKADEICLSCPVIQQCDAYAIESEQSTGSWGGFYRRSRGRVHRTKNSHKTRETWKRLEELLGRKINYEEHYFNE